MTIDGKVSEDNQKYFPPVKEVLKGAHLKGLENWMNKYVPDGEARIQLKLYVSQLLGGKL